MAGSTVEAIGRREQPAEVGVEVAGRVVWEVQEDRNPADQLSGLAATYAREIRASVRMVQKGEKKQRKEQTTTLNGQAEGFIELTSLPSC